VCIKLSCLNKLCSLKKWQISSSLQISKTTVTLEQAHTNDYAEKDEETTLVVQFQSILMGPPAYEPDNNADYAVVAAAQVANGAYVWIATEIVQTNLSYRVSRAQKINRVSYLNMEHSFSYKFISF